MLPGSGFQFCRRRRSTVFVERYTKQKCRLQKRQVKFLTSTKQFHISGNYECLGMSGYKFPDEQHRQNFENTKHVPFLFQKFTPFNFGDFCWPTRKLPSDIGCGFLHSCGHLRKCLRRVSEAAPRCEISEAHAQLLPPTSRIIRCKKGGWELFVETHMLLDVRCLGSSLASLWLTVVDVHFPLAEKELMAKNSVVWRETGWVLNIGHFLQDHWIILQAVTWWWLFWYQPQPITLIMNMLCCSSLLIGQCCSSEFICIPFYWVLRVLSAFFGGSLFVMLQAFGISTSILTMSWVLHR